MDLIDQMKNEESAAIDKLIDRYFAIIEQFAFQFGCSPEQAGEVAEEVFRVVFHDKDKLRDDKRPEQILYTITIDLMRNIQLKDSTLESVMPFEEDQQMHRTITRLNENSKISLILSQFHQMNHAEIASIMGTSEKEVSRAISDALQQFGKISQLEKRLSFLGKSYSRMKLSFNEENVFRNPHEDLNKPSKKRITRKSLLIWASGLIGLITVLAILVMTSDEYQKSSAEKYVERLIVSFEDEIESTLTGMGLPNSEDPAYQFHVETYATSAQEEFKWMIEDLKHQISKNEKINKKQTNKQFNEMIEKLEPPSKMVERLINNPLTTDREKSEEFINDYVAKSFFIKKLLSNVIVSTIPYR